MFLNIFRYTEIYFFLLNIVIPAPRTGCHLVCVKYTFSEWMKDVKFLSIWFSSFPTGDRCDDSGLGLIFYIFLD